MKLKLPTRYVNQAKGDLIKLIKKILQTHPRATATYLGKRTLTKHTGNLFKEIQPKFKINDKKVIIEVAMMDYYKFLDEGTKWIKPWYFSEEIMNEADLTKISSDLVAFTVVETLTDMVSKINKK